MNSFRRNLMLANSLSNNNMEGGGCSLGKNIHLVDGDNGQNGIDVYNYLICLYNTNGGNEYGQIEIPDEYSITKDVQLGFGGGVYTHTLSYAYFYDDHFELEFRMSLYILYSDGYLE